MLFLEQLTLLLSLCCIVLAQNPAITERIQGPESPYIAERQISDIFSTIDSICAGCPYTNPTPISPSISSTMASKSFSLAAKTTTSSTSTSRSEGTPTPAPIVTTAPYDPLALTTTFTQPAACTDYAAGFSVIEEWSDAMWYNAIYSKLPISLYSSCFPSQFYSSILATTSGLPFTALVCPHSWEPCNFSSTYVVCCPPGFMVVAPEIETNTRRPGEGAYCYSALGVGELMDVTIFDSTGGSTFVAMTAGSTTNNVVMADAFDGTAATPFTDLTPLPTYDVTSALTTESMALQTLGSSVAVSQTTEVLAPLSSSTGVAQTTPKTSSASKMTSTWWFSLLLPLGFIWA